MKLLSSLLAPVTIAFASSILGCGGAPVTGDLTLPGADAGDASASVDALSPVDATTPVDATAQDAADEASLDGAPPDEATVAFDASNAADAPADVTTCSDAGADCTPTNSCQRRTIDCSSGTAKCEAAGNAANGTPCGANAFCNDGVCGACTAGAACTPTPPSNPCDQGTTDCSTGTLRCTDTHSPDPAQNTRPCGTRLICSGGSCVVCDAMSCPNGCCSAAGACVTATSASACGTRGAVCEACSALRNVSGPTACTAGQCVVPPTSCTQGFAHCSSNPDDGCETDITRTPNCGACGTACSATQACFRSSCGCSMLGYWPANGNANDVVGQDNGILDGATFVPGVAGQALSFDGMSSMSVPKPPSLKTIGDFTYSLWINVASFVNGGIGAGDGSYFVDRTSATNPLVSLKAISNMFAFQVRYDDGTGLGGPIGGAIALSKWTHIAMQRVAGATFRLYANGQLAASVPDTGAPLTAPAFKLGRHESLLGFAGSIDDFRIYDHALTAAEIQAIAAGQECK